LSEEDEEIEKSKKKDKKRVKVWNRLSLCSIPALIKLNTTINVFSMSHLFLGYLP
jgi:hypothetical protein